MHINEEPEKSPAELAAELDFISTVSREFCYELEDLVDPESLSPQECYWAVSDVLDPLNLQSLKSLTEEGYLEIAVGLNDYFGTDTIEVAHIRSAVENIIGDGPDI